MGTGSKVAVAVASGYLLGRRRKLKLAITVGSMIAGKRIATNPRGALKQLNEVIENNPELSRLSDQVQDKLFEAARAAAIATASNQLNQVSDTIRARTEQLGLGELAPPEEYEDEAEYAEEEPAEEEPAEEEEPPEERPRRRSSASAKRTAKKSAPAKKTAKKSAPAKKTAKKSAPAKKTAKKSAPAKKTAKKSGSRARKRS